MALQPLHEVRKALSGAWDLTRAGFWWRAAESAAADRHWAVATKRLLNLADALEQVEHGGAAWHQLFVATLDTAVRAHDVQLVESTCAQILGQTYTSDSNLDELRPVFALAEREAQLSIGSRLGQILRQRVPTSPLGHYAAGHFDELRLLAGEPVRPSRVVAAFDRAAVLFGDSENGKHARLRAAVAQLAHTNQGEAGRNALRDAARDVRREDEAWLAWGRTFSSFWLDRVRAADWIGDELDQRSYGDELSGRRAAAVALELCRNLPPELTGPEEDRLGAAADALGDSIGGAIRRQLELRAEIADLLEQRLEDVSADTVHEFREIAALTAAWNGERPLVDPSGVAGAVIDVLLSEGEERENACGDLAAQVREERGDALKPLVLVLSRLRRGDGNDHLEEVTIHYARRASPPTCGFLPLAHKAFVAGMSRAGAALTRRAVDAGEGGQLAELCVARSVRWASAEASEAELRRWLELGESLLG